MQRRCEIRLRQLELSGRQDKGFELGSELPLVLREVYVRTGNRDEVHRVQEFLVPPDELWGEDGALVFYSENQGVCLRL